MYAMNIALWSLGILIVVTGWVEDRIA